MKIADKRSTQSKTVEYPSAKDKNGNDKIFNWFSQNRKHAKSLVTLPHRWTTTLRWSRSAALTPHHGGRALPHRRAGRVTPPRPSTRTRPCASAGCTPAE
ncbi:hypothetical protein NIA69_02655 [Gemmiger formicilis]|nr:hypothetical protein [Gemmiger formicilis]